MAGVGSKRPPNAGKGRPKGVPNKSTTLVKEGILAAYRSIGGDQALAEWARANPEPFYTRILTRILPHEMTGTDGSPIAFRVVFEDPQP